jgi:hypothetical protein
VGYARVAARAAEGDGELIVAFPALGRLSTAVMRLRGGGAVSLPVPTTRQPRAATARPPDLAYCPPQAVAIGRSGRAERAAAAANPAAARGKSTTRLERHRGTAARRPCADRLGGRPDRYGSGFLLDQQQVEGHRAGRFPVRDRRRGTERGHDWAMLRRLASSMATMTMFVAAGRSHLARNES